MIRSCSGGMGMIIMTAEEVLKNLLMFCEGYEMDRRKKSKDYYVLKKYIVRQLRKAEKLIMRGRLKMKKTKEPNLNDAFNKIQEKLLEMEKAEKILRQEREAACQKLDWISYTINENEEG